MLKHYERDYPYLSFIEDTLLAEESTANAAVHSEKNCIRCS